jgi:hypothetical protein
MSTGKVIDQQGGKKKKIKGVADIVFAVDVTASMQPCIDGLKESLNTFVENLQTTTGGQQQPLDWKARILPFRDVEADTDSLDNSFPFVTTASELKSQIEGLTADGGGDVPESIFDALYIGAKKSDWREPKKSHRTIVLFTDAYPHEMMHESTVESGEDRSINTILQLLGKEGIKLFIIAPKHELFEQLSFLPKSVYQDVSASGDAYDGLSKVDFNKLMEVIAKTVSMESEVIPA